MNIDEALDSREKAIKAAEDKKMADQEWELNRRKSELESLKPRIKKVIEIGEKIFKKFGTEGYKHVILERTEDETYWLFTVTSYGSLGFMKVEGDWFLGNWTGGFFCDGSFYTNGETIKGIDEEACISFLERFEPWERAFYNWLSKEFSMDKKPSVPTTTEVIEEKIKKVLTAGSKLTVGNVLDELYKKYDKNLVNQAMCNFLRDQYLV